jgi:hypothetical protein
MQQFKGRNEEEYLEDLAYGEKHILRFMGVGKLS